MKNSAEESEKIRTKGLHCADTCQEQRHRGVRGSSRLRHAVVASAAAGTTLILAALVIIVVYDYWPRALQKVSSAPNPAAASAPLPVAGELARRKIGAGRNEAGPIPVLVNALQDTRVAIATPPPPPSPRPFFYLHRGPTPAPFRTRAAAAPPRAWLDRYRSAQRLKNLEHVVQYLQRSARAQVADLLPASSDHIALAGVYVRPPGEPSAFEAGGDADPLRGYRPHHPGDVNLLAEEPLRFSLQPTAAESAAPRFRRIRFPPRRLCFGSRCTSCESVGEAFGLPEIAPRERFPPEPSLIAFDIFPDEPSASWSNRRRIARPASVLKPSFRPKGASSTNFLRDVYVVRSPSRPVHSAKTSVTDRKNLGLDFDTSTTKIRNGILHSTIQMSTKLPSYNFGSFGGSDFRKTIVEYATTSPGTIAPTTTTLPAVVPTVTPFLPYVHTYTSANSATTTSVDDVSKRTFDTLEILKFNAADARVPTIYGDDFPSHELADRQDERVESIVALAREEPKETARKVIGVKLRNERVSPASHATAASVASTTTTATSNGTAAPVTMRAEQQNNGHYRGSHHISWPQSQPSGTDTRVTAAGASRECRPTITPATPAPAGKGASRPEYVVIDRSAHRVVNRTQ